MPSENIWRPDPSTMTSSGYHRIRDWVRTPGYRTVPKEDLPVNGYHDLVTRPSVNFWGGTTEVRISNGDITHAVAPRYLMNLGDAEARAYATNTRWQTDPSQNVTGRIGDANNAALVRALGKASDAKVNIAVSLAEASKTSDMILDTARRIDRAYRAFRRGNLREVARQLNLTPRTSHKNWLAYKYGWTPLLLEVKGAAEFFAQQHVGRPVRFSVRAMQPVEFSWSLTTMYVPYGGTTPNYARSETLTGSYVRKVKMWLEVTNPNASALQQIGITNPALIAWELVPYSFVFDWFLQVGNYLQGLTALQGLTVRKAFHSSMFDLNIKESAPSTSATDGVWNYYNSSWQVGCHIRQYDRTSFNPDSASIYPPKGTGLSFERLVTGLALIRGSHRGSGNRI